MAGTFPQAAFAMRRLPVGRRTRPVHELVALCGRFAISWGEPLNQMH
jgi:hypothetical protein